MERICLAERFLSGVVVAGGVTGGEYGVAINFFGNKSYPQGNQRSSSQGQRIFFTTTKR